MNKTFIISEVIQDRKERDFVCIQYRDANGFSQEVDLYLKDIPELQHELWVIQQEQDLKRNLKYIDSLHKEYLINQ